MYIRLFIIQLIMYYIIDFVPQCINLYLINIWCVHNKSYLVLSMPTFAQDLHIIRGGCWFDRQSLLWPHTYPYLHMDVLHKSVFLLHHRYRHLHTEAMGWYMYEFCFGTLLHMWQNKSPTLTTKSNCHQLTSNNIRNVSSTVQMTEHAVISLFNHH